MRVCVRACVFRSDSYNVGEHHEQCGNLAAFIGLFSQHCTVAVGFLGGRGGDQGRISCKGHLSTIPFTPEKETSTQENRDEDCLRLSFLHPFELLGLHGCICPVCNCHEHAASMSNMMLIMLTFSGQWAHECI